MTYHPAIQAKGLRGIYYMRSCLLVCPSVCICISIQYLLGVGMYSVIKVLGNYSLGVPRYVW